MSTGKAIALLLIGGAIALAAYEIGRRSSQAPAPVSERPDATAGDLAPAAPRLAPSPIESGTTIEIPLGAEIPALAMETEAPSPVEQAAAPPDPPPAADWAPPEDRPPDTPVRCVMLQAYPSNVSAFGSSGEVVQLVVRAQNGCGSNFDSAWFRAFAIAPDGRELASASGRFPGGIRAGGSAETLIALRTKPAMGLTYRAEIQ